MLELTQTQLVERTEDPGMVKHACGQKNESDEGLVLFEPEDIITKEDQLANPILLLVGPQRKYCLDAIQPSAQLQHAHGVYRPYGYVRFEQFT